MKRDYQAGTKEKETLHTLVLSLYDIQATRIRLGNRFESPAQAHEYQEHIKALLSVENGIKRDINKKVDGWPIPIADWIMAQRGLGYDLAGQLMGIIQTSMRFDNISRLHSYFGLGLVDWCVKCNRPWYEPKKKAEKLETIARRLKEAHEKALVKTHKDFDAEAREQVCNCESPETKRITQKHHEGILGDYNPAAKTLAFKIGTQFVKQGDHYRKLYDRFRAEYEGRDDLKAEIEKKKGRKAKGKDADGKSAPVETKGTKHIHMMAQRRAVKRFLSDLWVVWRQLERLPRTDPWAVVHGDHSRVEPPPPPYVRVKDGQPYLDMSSIPKRSKKVDDESHSFSETQAVVASQVGREIQDCYASQAFIETQTNRASQELIEPQRMVASPTNLEPQRRNASQTNHETHCGFATPKTNESESTKGDEV